MYVCPSRSKNSEAIFQCAKHAASFEIKYIIQKKGIVTSWAPNTPFAAVRYGRLPHCEGVQHRRAHMRSNLCITWCSGMSNDGKVLSSTTLNFQPPIEWMYVYICVWYACYVLSQLGRLRSEVHRLLEKQCCGRLFVCQLYQAHYSGNVKWDR